MIETIDRIYFSMNNFSLNLNEFEKDFVIVIFDYPQIKSFVDLDLDVNSLIADLNTFTSDYSELLGQLRRCKYKYSYV